MPLTPGQTKSGKMMWPATVARPGHSTPKEIHMAHYHSTWTAEERFWDKVYMPPCQDDCWTWHGSTNGVGYGRFTPKSPTLVYSHRYAYETMVGPIPQGLELDHLCRNRACVNPSHLEPVTHRENTVRGLAPSINRARMLAKTHCRHGHPWDAENTIYTTRQRKCRACLRVYWKRQDAKRRHHV